tara:strand:- start:1338 stop:2024 length:687 start_codon:yes stop_codon:yes gene_type:complete
MLMAAKFKIVALIAVKGDSERIPRKNIKSFHDTSLLELKIRQLLKSDCVDKIVVSSESPEAIEIASSFEDILIHKRDPFYSSSDVPMSQVYTYLASEMNCEDIMWVPVTNPLISPSVYKDSVEQYLNIENEHDCLLSCVKINEYLLKDFKPLNFTRNPWQRSQDLEGIHALSFAVNILKRRDMIKWGSLVGKNPKFIELSREESTDIDFMDDFDYCEHIFKRNPGKYL